VLNRFDSEHVKVIKNWFKHLMHYIPHIYHKRSFKYIFSVPNILLYLCVQWGGAGGGGGGAAGGAGAGAESGSAEVPIPRRGISG
jgi:hypothetical protein